MPAAADDGVPVLPAGFLEESVEAWRALLAEPQASSLTGAQRIVARRWIEAVDAWLRALAIVKDAPLVQGSMGQPVLNPMHAVVVSREAAMEKCERQLGIGLKNKADLGLTVGQVELTAAHINSMYKGSDQGGNAAAGELGPQEEDWSPDAGWSAAE